MLIEDIKEKDLWRYFCVSGSLIAIQEIVRRHNKEREQNKENFYQKVCRYKKLYKEKNIQFLKRLFDYYDLCKQELDIKEDEIKVEKLIVFTAVKDYENRFDFLVG